MKLTDKRFWIFEALVRLSTALTVGLMELFYILSLDSDVLPICIIILITYLIGHAEAWKRNKSCAWLKLGLTTYLFSAVALAVIFAIILLIWSIVSFIPTMVTAFVASLCFRAKTTEATGMELKSISLESIGVEGIAYAKSEALRIAEEYYNSNLQFYIMADNVFANDI